MSPLGMLIAVILGVVCLVGTGYQGYSLGIDHQKAAQLDAQKQVDKAIEATNTTISKAIGRIQITNQTIKSEVERETHTNTIYADCKHSDVGLQLVNAALAGAKSPSGGAVPETVTP